MNCFEVVSVVNRNRTQSLSQTRKGSEKYNSKSSAGLAHLKRINKNTKFLILKTVSKYLRETPGFDKVSIVVVRHR